MLAALRALADDDATRVIVLISKPPSPTVASRILALAAASGKPTVVHFLGAAPGTVQGAGLHAAQSLANAADIAVALAQGGERTASSAAPNDSRADHERVLDGLAPTQRTVRGLFTGGTFCYEAQLAFLRRGLPCRSNAPVHGALPLDGSTGDHVFIDMGDDEYTRGRPHPMIDPSLRNAAIREAADDPAIAILLLDLVLGFGSHPSPADELADALRDAQRAAALQGRKLVSIGHVCGTDGDPQDRAAQIRTLASAGAIVADSNIEAASLAAQLALHLAQRSRRRRNEDAVQGHVESRQRRPRRLRRQRRRRGRRLRGASRGSRPRWVIATRRGRSRRSSTMPPSSTRTRLRSRAFSRPIPY